MDNHIKILGILHIIYGALRVLGGFLVLFFSRIAILAIEQLQYQGELRGLHGFDLNGLVHSIGFFLFLALVILGAAGIISGWGLLARQAWARILVLIVGILALIKIPFGTALGIYTLWVIFKSEPTKETPAPA